MCADPRPDRISAPWQALYKLSAAASPSPPIEENGQRMPFSPSGKKWKLWDFFDVRPQEDKSARAGFVAQLKRGNHVGFFLRSVLAFGFDLAKHRFDVVLALCDDIRVKAAGSDR